MAFKILNPTEVSHYGRSLSQQTKRKTTIPSCSITGKKQGRTRQLIISRAFISTLGEATTHVAIEFDDEAKRLVIRPSTWGEPAFKLTKTGQGTNGRANRAISVTSLITYLGANRAFTGKLRTRVKDGALHIDLGPVFKTTKVA